MNLIQERNWLDHDQEPSKLYFFELSSGQRGEANSPLLLFDLICEDAYSDCDDRSTQLIMLAQLLRNVAGQVLAIEGIRATVYSGTGPFYDNMISRHPDEIEEEGSLEFANADEPVILDFWDEWTTIASLVKCGYLRLYEKVPTFTAGREGLCKDGLFYQQETDSCNACGQHDAARLNTRCTFFTPAGTATEEYKEVNPEDLQEPDWKAEYVPIEERTEEYKYFRIPKE